MSDDNFQGKMQAYLYGRHSTVSLKIVALSREIENLEIDLQVIEELYIEAGGKQEELEFRLTKKG